MRQVVLQSLELISTLRLHLLEINNPVQLVALLTKRAAQGRKGLQVAHSVPKLILQAILSHRPIREWSQQMVVISSIRLCRIRRMANNSKQQLLHLEMLRILQPWQNSRNQAVVLLLEAIAMNPKRSSQWNTTTMEVQIRHNSFCRVWIQTRFMCSRLVPAISWPITIITITTRVRLARVPWVLPIITTWHSFIQTRRWILTSQLQRQQGARARLTIMSSDKKTRNQQVVRGWIWCDRTNNRTKTVHTRQSSSKRQTEQTCRQQSQQMRIHIRISLEAMAMALALEAKEPITIR